jgi:hypothetical protein
MEHYRTNLDEKIALENRLLWTTYDTLVLKIRVRKMITLLRQVKKRHLTNTSLPFRLTFFPLYHVTRRPFVIKSACLQVRQVR